MTTLKAEAINFCANNYLGLADDPSIIESSKRALDEWGFGMASVRFICGTQRQHTDLERRIADFLGMEAAILYSSCFDANGGVFEVLFGAEDAIISDELNHASIIDGIRLSKAMRYRYKNADLGDLRAQLEAAVAAGAKRKVIVTDGVFSMDGSYAPLEGICDLADEFGALVFVDDSHAVGFIGAGGARDAGALGVMDRVDIITGTLGKALGGASGGYVASHQEVVDLLRQRSRPYLFSNSVAPAVVAGSMRALELIESSGEKREILRRNTELFDRLMREPASTCCPGRTRSARHVPRRRRGSPRHRDRRPHARARRLRHRVQLPRRAAREGSHPGPALGGPFGGRRPRVRRRVRRSQGRGRLSQRHEPYAAGLAPADVAGSRRWLGREAHPGLLRTRHGQRHHLDRLEPQRFSRAVHRAARRVHRVLRRPRRAQRVALRGPSARDDRRLP